MYGKLFSSMYEGSMVGAGPVVFAVWGYCIAKADLDGTVLLNPQLLAPIIGTSRVEIDQAMKYLQEPDEHSKNPEHDGRRLLHQTGHLYFVVSHEHYRNMKNNEERREYMRGYMRERRKKEPVNSLQSLQNLTKVNPASASASSSGKEGGAGEGKQKAGKKQDDAGFAEAWAAYPDKSGKAAARAAYQKAVKEGDAQPDILAGIARYRAYVERKRENGHDLQWRNGSTFFNQRGWQDEWAADPQKPVADSGRKTNAASKQLVNHYQDPVPDMAMRKAF